MSLDVNDSYVNQAAFVLSVSSSVAAVASGFATASAKTAGKTAAMGALTLGCATGAASAVTAWLDPSSKDVKSYLKNVKSHFGYGLSGMATFVAQEVSAAIVKGFSQALQDGIYDKVRGYFDPKKTEEEKARS